MQLNIYVLGSIELYRDGAQVAIGPTKRRAMLAALALDANRSVSLDQLTAAVWAGTPPDSAVANLRTHPTALPRFLGDRLVARPPRYLPRAEPGQGDVD